MKRTFAFLFLLSVITCSFSQPITSDGIDSIVTAAMKTFDVPGISVAVVKDGAVIHLKGYGVRSINTMEKVDEHTLFAIASNTKAFTAATLAILVDEGKLKWNDRVTDYIPEFKLYDPWVTAEFTIKDLLTHRSGLGLGAGDLMIWPESPLFTKEEIINKMRYLKPASSFRTKYDYDNLLYMVAGEVVGKVSGMSWENFVEKKIMVPLDMTRSAASITRLKDRNNIIDAHVPVNGKLTVVDKNEGDVHNSLGGIFASASDLSKWVMMQINNGRYGASLEKHIFSERAHEEMWTPQTIIPVRSQNSYNTHFSSYGLGWFLSDVKGYKQASHTGALMGMVTQVTILPELKLGIIVLTNQQSGAAFTTITNTIKDSYLGVTDRDRLREMKEADDREKSEAAKITTAIWNEIEAQAKTKGPKPDLRPFAGTYTDAWFGDVLITLNDGKLWFEALKSPKLTGEMMFYKGNTFIVKWNDRSLDADAFAIFSLDKEGNPAAMTMEAVSPLTDFSFDFQDLAFRKK